MLKITPDGGEGSAADPPEQDRAELPDLGSAFNGGTAWRHEPARLSGTG